MKQVKLEDRGSVQPKATAPAAAPVAARVIFIMERPHVTAMLNQLGVQPQATVLSGFLCDT